MGKLLRLPQDLSQYTGSFDSIYSHTPSMLLNCKRFKFTCISLFTVRIHRQFWGQVAALFCWRFFWPSSAAETSSPTLWQCRPSGSPSDLCRSPEWPRVLQRLGVSYCPSTSLWTRIYKRWNKQKQCSNRYRVNNNNKDQGKGLFHTCNLQLTIQPL